METKNGPLDLLRKKKLNKPPPVFLIKLKKGITSDKKDNEKNEIPNYLKFESIIQRTFSEKKDTNKLDEELENEQEQEEISKKQKPDIIFGDKRQDYDVNREQVLKRLNTFMNVKVIENSKEGVIPNVEIKTNEFKMPLVNGIIFTTEMDKINKKSAKLPEYITLGEKIEEELNNDYEELEQIEDIEDEIEKEIEDAEKEDIINPKPENKKVKITGKEEKKTGKEKKIEEEPGKEKEEDISEKKELKKGTKKIYQNYTFDQSKINLGLKVGRKTIGNRLPKPEKMVIRVSEYYMNNRKMYIQQMTELFRPYKKEILENAENLSCSQTASVDIKLLTHQKVVRDYLNIYTPYRGLLLYHALGSGKTCTSIAIAEGMKSDKQIILLTPASLKMNFFSELKKCGDVMYRKNQYWEFISTVGNPELMDTLSNILQISIPVITKNNGAWLVDFSKKESNFENLNTEQKEEIDTQLNLMIRAKYQDINYNGMRKNKVDEWIKDGNPFDNKTVIIDESHNFVSRIVNKIKKPGSISYIMYDLLMKAVNCKIILLSGTPMINYTNELAILFNILRGYIKVWTFQLVIKDTGKENIKINKEAIVNMFRENKLITYDYVEYSGNKLTITRNPYGFVNTYDNKKKGGSKKTSDNILQKTKKNIKHLPKKKSAKNKNSDSHFIIEDDVIKKIISQEEEENEFEGLTGEETSEYNQRIFIDMHKGGDRSSITEYDGITLNEQGNISDEDFVKEIERILTKNGIQIMKAGTDYKEYKALPDDKDEFNSTFVDVETGNMKNENAFKKRILGLTSYYRSAAEQLLPSFVTTETGENYHIVPVEMSKYQFSQYEKIRKDEADTETQLKKAKRMAEKKGIIGDISSTYRIRSRAVCNYAFPVPPGRPLPEKHNGDELLDENKMDALTAEQILQSDSFSSHDDVENHVEDLDYITRIKNAMKFIEYDPEHPKEEEYVTKDALNTYSPKFAKILENIMDENNKGLHLFYSQFRTIEGIGIFRLILKASGFAEFKIRKTEDSDSWRIEENEEDVGKPKFVLYTGTETAEEKEIVRNVYNGDWSVLPSSIANRLREISSNNYFGEIIKLFMITSSGAEGINLKNTRFVHITEPYWNMVRIEQVIGRARRICSHKDLDEEYRNVKVFLYLSVFSEEQKNNKMNIELMNRDKSRIDGRSVTTDENLLDISIIKKRVSSQLMNAIKETAVDCNIFNPYNKSENLVCYGFGKVYTNAFSSHPTLDEDILDKSEIAVKKQTIKLKASKPIDGVIYAIDPTTLDAYEMESYELAKKGQGELVLVGKIVQIEKNKFRLDKL